MVYAEYMRFLRPLVGMPLLIVSILALLIGVLLTIGGENFGPLVLVIAVGAMALAMFILIGIRDHRYCPVCDERVKQAALVCKHCHAYLDSFEKAPAKA
jgi:hypothetical protein